MKMLRRILAAALLAGATLLPAAALAQPPIPPIPGCARQQLSSGAFTLICMPPPEIWNGELVVFAHGYVPSSNPVLNFYHLGASGWHPDSSARVGSRLRLCDDDLPPERTRHTGRRR